MGFVEFDTLKFLANETSYNRIICFILHPNVRNNSTFPLLQRIHIFSKLSKLPAILVKFIAEKYICC